MELNEVMDILGTTRSKTDAGGFLNEFIESGALGKEISLTDGTFAGKDVKQVKTALDNARKKVSDETGNLVIQGGTDLQIRIKQNTNGKRGKEKVVTSEHVFIINTKLVGEAQAAQA
jgi:hypothetical protein